VAVRAALRLLGKEKDYGPLAVEAFNESGFDVAQVLYEQTGQAEPQEQAWGHVGKDALQGLRAAYSRYLDYRVHASSHIPAIGPTPPPDQHGACLLCGVDRAGAWRRLDARGLVRSDGLVSGHLCGTCSAVMDEVGAVGPTLLERAFLEATGRTWDEDTRIDGLSAWIATGRSPGKPWAWVKYVEAPPELSPLDELRLEVHDLRAELAELRGRL
jgi:hypothetical protein